MDKDKLMMKGVVIIDKDLLKNIKGRGGDDDELDSKFTKY